MSVHQQYFFWECGISACNMMDMMDLVDMVDMMGMVDMVDMVDMMDIKLSRNVRFVEF